MSFSKVGDADLRPALPLVRVGGERVFRKREGLDYTVPHGFAGSILNLEFGAEHEYPLALSDPDGAFGEASRIVRITARSEPQPYSAIFS